jgi:hypothetical protein
VGSSTSHNPIGLHGLLRGYLYFTFYFSFVSHLPANFFSFIAGCSTTLSASHDDMTDEFERIRKEMAVHTQNTVPAFSVAAGYPHELSKIVCCP